MRPSDSPEQDAAAEVGVKRAEFGRFALENLFEISPDAIFVTDGEGVIREQTRVLLSYLVTRFPS